MDYVKDLRERKRIEVPPALAEERLHMSNKMKAAWKRMRKAAESDETVLLCGESGAGKSYYADVIHRLSSRRKGPFVEVGMTADVGSENLIQSNLFGHVRGAFTGADSDKQGLFALANGGTIFLDEIGDASPELQAKLLRVLEKKSFKRLGGIRDVSVDVRIIAATNKNLAEMVQRGEFREDLFYRLNVISIRLPPLRERMEDLPALIKTLFEQARIQTGRCHKRLSDETFKVLLSYHWPGNIRDLENALRHAVIFSEQEEVLPEDLPRQIRGSVGCFGSQVAGRIVNRDLLKRAISAVPRVPDAPTFCWQAHVDYARREYLEALIHHYNGDLTKISEHWNRSSGNTLLKLVRNFDLEDELRTARKGEL